MVDDSYKTIATAVECASRERSSKFLSYIYPVQTEEQIREALEALRKRYFDATPNTPILSFAHSSCERNTCSMMSLTAPAPPQNSET